MQSLSALAKELGVSVATVSYVYNDKWRENHIHPDLAERVQRKLETERGAPDTLGRQLRSGRTQSVGVLLPDLDQPSFLHLLAGIENRLSGETAAAGAHRGPDRCPQFFGTGPPDARLLQGSGLESRPGDGVGGCLALGDVHHAEDAVNDHRYEAANRRG